MTYGRSDLCDLSDVWGLRDLFDFGHRRDRCGLCVLSDPCDLMIYVTYVVCVIDVISAIYVIYVILAV